MVAIEVKPGAAVDDHDVRHLRWFSTILGDNLLDMIIVTTGTEAYRRPDGIAVVPVALLGALVAMGHPSTGGDHSRDMAPANHGLV